MKFHRPLLELAVSQNCGIFLYGTLFPIPSIPIKKLMPHPIHIATLPSFNKCFIFPTWTSPLFLLLIEYSNYTQIISLEAILWNILQHSEAFRRSSKSKHQNLNKRKYRGIGICEFEHHFELKKLHSNFPLNQMEQSEFTRKKRNNHLKSFY